MHGNLHPGETFTPNFTIIFIKYVEVIPQNTSWKGLFCGSNIITGNIFPNELSRDLQEKSVTV